MSNIIDDNQWQCRRCERNFDTRGKRDAHHRKEHQKVTTNIDGMTENNGVTRNEGEKFSCQCGKGFWRLYSLQRHSKSCSAPMLTVGIDGDHANEDEGTSYESYRTLLKSMICISLKFRIY